MLLRCTKTVKKLYFFPISNILIEVVNLLIFSIIVVLFNSKFMPLNKANIANILFGNCDIKKSEGMATTYVNR